MTTFDKCLTTKASEGKVDKKKAKVVTERYLQSVEDIMDGAGVSRAEAEQQAIELLQSTAEREIARKKRIAMTQARTMMDIRAQAKAGEDAGVPVDVTMSHRLASDPRQRVTGVSLDERIKVVRSEAQAKMVDFLDTFRTKAAGLTQLKTGIDDVIREMFGENSGNAAAKAMAGGLKEATEHLRLRFNAAGGDIIDRGDWGFFQVHDKGRIAAVDKQEWMRFVMDRLDMEKMVDVNGNPMTRKQVFASLDDVYDSVATGGMSDLTKPVGPTLFGSAINKRANSRYLNFKSPDAWLEYQREFGSPNLFDHVVGSIGSMAREVAILETLGPHPDATIRFMERLVDQAAAKGAISKTGKVARGLSEGLGQHRRPLTQLYNTVSGRIAIPENGVISTISQANRNLQVAATLGGAFFSAIADVATSALTARMNGLSIARVIGRQTKLFLPTSAADRKMAVQLGFGAQGWASRAIGAQRIMGEVTGPEITERIADTVLRASFLSPWTESGRWGFGVEMLGHITRNSKNSFDKLDTATKGFLERHGITGEEWDLIRTTQKWVDPDSKAEFIRAEDVARGEFGTPAFEAGNKLQQAIFAETEFAIVSASPRVRSFLTGGAPAGTFWGEVMRNTALFKSFPLTIMHQHLSRMMAQRGVMNKAQYGAWMFISMTAMGVIGEQMTQISKGRDPLNIDEPKLWLNAAVRGGSLGLLGDLVLQDHNRYGGGLWDGLLGPVAGQVEDIFKLTAGNIQELIEGKDTNAGRELSRFVEANFPGRSLWYTRLVTERMIFDELDAFLDPKARENFTRVERNAQKDYNQKFFWRPGRTTPRRAPDVGQ